MCHRGVSRGATSSEGGREEGRQKMLFNGTTAHSWARDPAGVGPRAYYALVPVALLVLAACVVAVVYYVRRRSRLDELRHRLIPLYTYDPTEQEDWEDWEQEGGDEEEELAEEVRLALI